MYSFAGTWSIWTTNFFYNQFKHTEALYNTLRVVISAFIAHAVHSTQWVTFKSKTEKRKPQKIFFNARFMILFQNYVMKITPQHVNSKYNSCHLIQCGRVDFKTILSNRKWVPCLQSSKLSFRSSKRCRKIDCQTHFTWTCVKCELLDISRQILRF